MTFAEVKSAGAEIVRVAFTAAPSDGWEETSVEQLQGIKKDALRKREFARSVADHDRAGRWFEGSSAALEKAEKGERVFYVHWDDELVFAEHDRTHRIPFACVQVYTNPPRELGLLKNPLK